MIFTITCLHCGKDFPRIPQSKTQRYCSSRKCQNARRNRSAKTKQRNNARDRLLRQARNKRYRDTHPSHEYQKNYRARHPEYVKRNCELQVERNKKRQEVAASMIVKTYALSPQPLQDGAYMGFEVKNKKIVKTYALMAQKQAMSDIEVYSGPKSV
jgi:endogenous inhibitor of DNA gyrase (YacG/DUF329 family)